MTKYAIEAPTPMQAREATLDVPTLILPSVQVNVRAGQLRPGNDNEMSYPRIPLNALPLRR